MLENSGSIFELPFGFSAFDIPFIQLVLTPADVHLLVSIVQAVDAIPVNVKPFQEQKAYFREIDYQSFWIRVYVKRRSPLDPSSSLRKVVFGDVINDFEHLENPDFERIWRELVNLCQGERPVDKLLDSPIFKKVMGDRYDSFLDFVIQRSLDDLNERAVTFEHFLVHSMHLRTLVQWAATVRAHMDKKLVPYAASEILKELNTVNISKISQIDAFVAKITIRPLVQFSTIIQKFLPLILTKQRKLQLVQLEAMWAAVMLEAQSDVRLPELHKNVRMRLWNAIEQLKCINVVEFSSVMGVLLEALAMIQELEKVNDKVLPYAIVYSDCRQIPSHFLMITCLIVRQKFLRLLDDREDELFLWFKLEAAVLKLAARDEALMSLYLRIQDDFSGIL
jgi:hypothetical protein